MSLSEQKSSIINRITKDINDADDYKEILQVFENYLEECKHNIAVEENSNNENYKENIKQLWLSYLSQYCKDEKVLDNFLNKLLENIKILPEIIMYEVPAKHGDSIFYTLVFFETKEKYGFQKVLLDKYELKYDSECMGWDFTSQETINKSFTIQEHKLHLSKYQIPSEIPANAKQEDIFEEYSEDFIHQYMAMKEEEYTSVLKTETEIELNEKDFEKILDYYPIWRIIVGITNFNDL